MNKHEIIGIAGTNGSGKDTVGHMLAEKHGYLFISVTDLLRNELVRRGLPPAREHMRELSAEWRRELGLGVLVDRAVAEYDKQKDEYQGLAIASLRNPGEADEVHALGGTVLWIDAEPKIRYERIKAAKRDAIRAVDDDKTFEQFQAEEAAEMHKASGADAATLDMASVKERADVMIDNGHEDLSELHQQLVDLFSL